MPSIRDSFTWGRLFGVFVVLATIGLVLRFQPVTAEVTAEHRKQLAALRSDVGKVPTLLKAKKFDDAESALTTAEQKLQEIATNAGVPVDDRSLLGVATLIKKQREALAKFQARAGGAKQDDGLSFSREVAPIIADACLGCHSGQSARGNLRLETFAGWKRGGRSGPLLVVGDANSSLLMPCAPPIRSGACRRTPIR